MMKAKRLFFAATHPAAVGASREALAEDEELMRQLKAGAARLPVEGTFPALDGATGWLNSEPLTPQSLRGKVVAIDFLTYTCINWLRTLPYIRAWAEKYKDHGLTVIGVHTPEFPFEKDIDNVRREMNNRVAFPVAVDSDYGVWNAFDNQYWPALYFIDTMGQVRHHQFGEGSYDMSEMVIQQLLADAGFTGFRDDLVSVDPQGIEVAADWEDLESQENYVGYGKSDGFSSPGGTVYDEPHRYAAPARLGLNQWALSGDWSIAEGFAELNEGGGFVAYRFHARDLHLVMTPGAQGKPIRFQVTIDGDEPGSAHGADIAQVGNGTVTDARTYQLIRQPGSIADRQFEIKFLDPGVQVFCFTFG
jgi:thiol-disulfide isomerase/thioredoxin